jgi:uncharacterized protein (TIGR02145 family)
MKNKSMLMAIAIFLVAMSAMAQESGSFTDTRDGKTYQTIKIGTQTWMAENFAYKPEKGNFWAYGEDKKNVEKYGFLYDLETAKMIVPVGWHLPSKDEWETLYNYLDGEGKVVYQKVIQGGSSGFNALLSGYCLASTPPDYILMDAYTGFWTSTPDDEKGAWSFGINAFSEDAHVVGSNPEGCGLSVRLIKD